MVNDVPEYAPNRESSTENMENGGYPVSWSDTRKHIADTCPNGRKRRNNRLPDGLPLIENPEILFASRQAVGFYSGTAEPSEDRMGGLVSGIRRLKG